MGGNREGERADSQLINLDPKTCMDACMQERERERERAGITFFYAAVVSWSAIYYTSPCAGLKEHLAQVLGCLFQVSHWVAFFRSHIAI